jgi:hypothetical protein
LVIAPAFDPYRVFLIFIAVPSLGEQHAIVSTWKKESGLMGSYGYSKNDKLLQERRAPLTRPVVSAGPNTEVTMQLKTTFNDSRARLLNGRL